MGPSGPEEQPHIYRGVPVEDDAAPFAVQHSEPALSGSRAACPFEGKPPGGIACRPEFPTFRTTHVIEHR
jgi:hypothetical protein